MRRLSFFLILLLSAASLFASSISFSGGRSSLSLKEGKEEVVLSDGAKVSVDQIRIESNKITLSGNGWMEVVCEGKTKIEDLENKIEIRTSGLWFDRTEERMIISSWFEIDDRKNEISATGNSLLFNMKTGMLTLEKDVTLLKITESGIMKCKAESVILDRDNQKISLRGNASVIWNGEEYNAEAIFVDLETEEISLEGRIKGSING